MSGYQSLRNVCLVGHGGAGKTSLAEAILFNTKTNDRLGRVLEETTLTDNLPDEVKRKMTLLAKVFSCQWKNVLFNLLITPGYADFIGEVIASLKVTDSCIFILDAYTGVEVQTEKIWQMAEQSQIPTAFFINKMDKENARFNYVLEMSRKMLSSKILPLQLPIGKGENFKGVVDLLNQQAFFYAEFGQKAKREKKEIPPELKEEAEKLYSQIVETVAETDDALLEKYLEEGELKKEEVLVGLKKAVNQRQIIPCFCGSAYLNIGVSELSDGIEKILPSPQERGEIKGTHPQTQAEEVRKPAEEESFSGFIFKTVTEPHIGELAFIKVCSGKISSGMNVYNPKKRQREKIGAIIKMKGKNKVDVGTLSVGDIGCLVKLKNTKTNDTLCDESQQIIFPPIEFPEALTSFSVLPKAKGDEEKLSTLLAKFAEDDPCFHFYRDTATKEMVVSGMGDLHLEIMIERLTRKFGVEAKLGRPKIAYKETIKGTAKAQGKHKKQTGGRGQYGDVWLELTPLPRGKGFEFEDKIFGGAIPAKYVPSIEKGVREVLEQGVLANYPIIDIHVTVYDGSFHPVDSSDIAFKIAAALSFKKAFMEAKPVLLEPIMEIEVNVPEEYMGDITSDLNSRRGRILGMTAMSNSQVVKAYVPQAELYKYATDLRSKTQGRGSFMVRFAHYEEVPSHLAEKIIAESKKETK
jgi:elongation factor G